MTIPKIVNNVKPKKIIFDDDGAVVNEVKKTLRNGRKDETEVKSDLDKVEVKEDNSDCGEDFFSMREKKKSKQKSGSKDEEPDVSRKWYLVYPQYPATEEISDMKENDQMELYNICRSSYGQEKETFLKQNPSDARWLQTAINKGTAKDRANAGALLVTSNPLANLEALSSLIGFTRLSNKCSTEVISTVADLWKEVLLPPHRKLYSIEMRGADWKLVRKDASLNKDQQRKIYAYWHFENELKNQYFDFLKNIQQSIQMGQENNKTICIVIASQLLSFGPEKEQMLLTMLINKLGDPIAKVASKALHCLTEVALRHPNMCGVIVNETEKLLFRNNISDRAQHFALCYLASIAPTGKSEICTKLVTICFSLFKVLVQKGAINNRTMQAILRCLQKAILETKPLSGNTELLNKEMQDTIYRLVHLADIRVSIQTLGLLLQLVLVKTEKSDRFYNALYSKLVDLNLFTIGSKSAAQLLHIIHRAIYIDSNIPRAQAFMKRILQLALYMPSNMAAGCLIVIHKLVRSRKELLSTLNDTTNNNFVEVNVADDELLKFESDGEEKYDDIHDSNDRYEENKEESQSTTNIESSWHHSKVSHCDSDKNVWELTPSKYNPYHRVPTFAGTELVFRSELVLLRQHFHPTVQVFADNILNNKRIDYYGDPLRDFSLSHFLERFSFKNPKKVDQETKGTSILSHKHYVSYGTRGLPVWSLTSNNCSEEEIFIFNYLEQKRKQSFMKNANVSPGNDVTDNDYDGLKAVEVDDDEFEDYLDGFFGKKSKDANNENRGDNEDIDFLKEFGDAIHTDSKRNNAKKKVVLADEDEVESIDADWCDDDDKEDFSGSNMSEDEDDEIDDNEDEDEVHSDSDINDFEPKYKKSKKTSLYEMNECSFAKKLKQSDDMSSLFAAADDFAELLEETAKTKGHGTVNDVSNMDKSSAKQLKWEEKRRSNAKTYKNKIKVSGGKMFPKKRKH